jgi:hypothetical protein
MDARSGGGFLKDNYVFCVKNQQGDIIVLLTKIGKYRVGNLVQLGKWMEFNFRCA